MTSREKHPSEPDALVFRRTAPAWTQEAWARYAQLEGRLRFVPEGRRAAIEAKLARAKSSLDDPVPRGVRARLSNWWTGDRIERTWTWLEQAEIDLVSSSDDHGLRIALSIALQRAESALPDKDDRRVALDELAAAADSQPNASLVEVAARASRRQPRGRRS